MNNKGGTGAAKTTETTKEGKAAAAVSAPASTGVAAATGAASTVKGDAAATQTAGKHTNKEGSEDAGLDAVMRLILGFAASRGSNVVVVRFSPSKAQPAPATAPAPTRTTDEEG